MQRLVDVQLRPPFNPLHLGRRVCFKCRKRVAEVCDLCCQCEARLGEKIRAEIGEELAATAAEDERPVKPAKPEPRILESWVGCGTVRDVVSRCKGRVTYLTGARRIRRVAHEAMFDFWVRETQAKRVK